MQYEGKIGPRCENSPASYGLNNVSQPKTDKCPEKPVSTKLERVFYSRGQRRIKRYGGEVMTDRPDDDHDEKIETPNLLIDPGKSHPPIEDKDEKEESGKHKVRVVDFPAIDRADDPAKNMGDADAEDDRDENRQILEFAHAGVLRLPIRQDAELLDLIAAFLTRQLGSSGSKQTDSDWPRDSSAESASDCLLSARSRRRLK